MFISKKSKNVFRKPIVVGRSINSVSQKNTIEYVETFVTTTEDTNEVKETKSKNKRKNKNNID